MMSSDFAEFMLFNCLKTVQKMDDSIYMDGCNSFVKDIFDSFRRGNNPFYEEWSSTQDGAENSRDYHPNHCRVCQALNNEKNPLKRCSRCQLISYCGKEHQIQDWNEHKDLCKALSELGGPSMFRNLMQCKYGDKAPLMIDALFYGKQSMLKTKALSDLTTKLARKPSLFEMQLTIYPRVCCVCFQWDPKLLRICATCPQTICVEHINEPSHLKMCSTFKLSYEFEFNKEIKNIFFILRKSTSVFFNLPYQREGTSLPSSMEEFLHNDSCITIRTDVHLQKKIIPKQFCEVFLSEALCRPLTLLYAIEKLKLRVTSFLLIHVIGATSEDVDYVFWHVILHWLRVKNLKIVFIGPHIGHLRNNERVISDFDTCKNCKKWKVKLEYQFHKTFYEDYCSSENYSKPDFIAAYNAGFFAYPTWDPTLKIIQSEHVPLVVTAYNNTEARMDHNKLETVVGDARYLFSETNPFADLHWQRSNSYETVYVNNQIVTIYDSL